MSALTTKTHAPKNATRLTTRFTVKLRGGKKGGRWLLSRARVTKGYSRHEDPK